MMQKDVDPELGSNMIQVRRADEQVVQDIQGYAGRIEVRAQGLIADSVIGPGYASSDAVALPVISSSHTLFFFFDWLVGVV